MQFLSLPPLLPVHMKLFVFSVVLGAALILTSLAMADDKKNEYTKEDNNKDVTLELYNVTSLRLPVQMGTGYSWKVASLPDVLEQESVSVEGGGIPGAPETQLFRFMPIKKGNGKLVLEQVRPWEKTDLPQETFTLNLTVE